MKYKYTGTDKRLLSLYTAIDNLNTSVDNLGNRIVLITEADFKKLTTKEATTLYLIAGKAIYYGDTLILGDAVTTTTTS